MKEGVKEKEGKSEKSDRKKEKLQQQQQQAQQQQDTSQDQVPILATCITEALLSVYLSINTCNRCYRNVKISYSKIIILHEIIFIPLSIQGKRLI